MNKLKSIIPIIPGMTENTLMNLKNQSAPMVIETHGKITLKKFLGWTYTIEDDHPNINNVSDKKFISQMISMYSRFICNMYLSDTPTYPLEELPLKNIEPSEVFRMTNRISNMSNKLFKISNGFDLRCRLISKDFTLLLNISPPIDDTDGISFSLVLFNRYRKICRCNAFVISKSNEMKIFNDVLGTPIYLARKDRDIEKIYNKKDNTSVDIFNLQIIYSALQMLVENHDIDQTSYKNYTDTEIYIIKTILQDKLKLHIWPKDLHNWTNNDVCFYKSIFNQLDKNSIDFVMEQLSNSESFPKIDLSEKEFNFIKKYTERNGFISGKDTKVFNLLQYMINPSYGNSFQFPVEYTDGTKDVITTSFMIDDMNNLRIFIMQKISDLYSVFSWINFRDIENFQIGNSLTHINSSIIFTDVENIPLSGQDVYDSIPEIFLNAKAIESIIFEILSLHIVIYDRPTRTRMVKCSSRVKKEITLNKKETKEEYDFVVTRILKTVLDAKEYVARMSSGGYIDREYSLESWRRKGYYRKTKAGGAVWIPPTTCHRHLPLTEKELHIKL